MLKSLLFALFCLLLTSCMDAAVTGAQVVYDQNHLRKTLHDKYTSIRAERAIYLDTDRFADTHVSVDTFHNVILLTGQAPQFVARQNIADTVKQIVDPNTKIYNMITVASPTDALTRASDAWITAKIKAKFITDDAIDPDAIKVVTENGTVYLMGTVLHEQGNAAIDIARSTDGVRSVVKLFDWLSRDAG